MWKNYQVDLRKLRGKNLSQELMKEAYGEIYEMNSGRVELSVGDDISKVTITGKDSKGRLSSEEWSVREYIKKARQYDKLKTRVDKLRGKNDIESYDYEELYELPMKKSKAINKRIVNYGLENRVETLKKVLKRDPTTKRNKLEEATFNRIEAMRTKHESFGNVDEILKQAGIDKKDYMNSKGKFKSKAKEREYLKKFSEAIDDEDYTDSGEFYGWVYENYVANEKGMTTKNFMGALSKDEQHQLYKEFYEEQFEYRIDRAVEEERPEEEIEKLIALREAIK